LAVVTATSIILIAAAGGFAIIMAIWGLRGLIKNWNPAQADSSEES